MKTCQLILVTLTTTAIFACSSGVKSNKLSNSSINNNSSISGISKLQYKQTSHGRIKITDNDMDKKISSDLNSLDYVIQNPKYSINQIQLAVAPYQIINSVVVGLNLVLKSYQTINGGFASLNAIELMGPLGAILSLSALITSVTAEQPYQGEIDQLQKQIENITSQLTALSNNVTTLEQSITATQYILYDVSEASAKLATNTLINAINNVGIYYPDTANGSYLADGTYPTYLKYSYMSNNISNNCNGQTESSLANCIESFATNADAMSTLAKYYPNIDSNILTNIDSITGYNTVIDSNQNVTFNRNINSALDGYLSALQSELKSQILYTSSNKDTKYYINDELTAYNNTIKLMYQQILLSLILSKQIQTQVSMLNYANALSSIVNGTALNQISPSMYNNSSTFFYYDPSSTIFDHTNESALISSMNINLSTVLSNIETMGQNKVNLLEGVVASYMISDPATPNQVISNVANADQYINIDGTTLTIESYQTFLENFTPAKEFIKTLGLGVNPSGVYESYMNIYQYQGLTDYSSCDANGENCKGLYQQYQTTSGNATTTDVAGGWSYDYLQMFYFDNTNKINIVKPISYVTNCFPDQTQSSSVTLFPTVLGTPYTLTGGGYDSNNNLLPYTITKNDDFVKGKLISSLNALTAIDAPTESVPILECQNKNFLAYTAPSGTYQQTCNNVKIWGGKGEVDILVGSCKNTKGQYVNSMVGIEPWNSSSPITCNNINGQLECSDSTGEVNRDYGTYSLAYINGVNNFYMSRDRSSASQAPTIKQIMFAGFNFNLAAQPDNNFVVYGGDSNDSNDALWSTGTGFTPNDGSSTSGLDFIQQSDNNLVLTDYFDIMYTTYSKVLWNAGTNTSNNQDPVLLLSNVGMFWNPTAGWYGQNNNYH